MIKNYLRFLPKDELRFILKDKYHWSELDITDFLLKDDYTDITGSLKNDIDLINSGYPLAYVIGYVDFLGCKIDLRYKPLIPRAETEFWVESAYKTWSYRGKLAYRRKLAYGKNDVINCLDLCCGSGCIGIALLKNNPNTHVTFIDNDENAIKQTEYNLELNEIAKGRYKVIKSDLFAELDKLPNTAQYDYIFSNPPYVSENDKVGAETKHEPQEALYANDSGMGIIKKVLNDSPKYLKPNGRLYMEFGSEQKELIEKYLFSSEKNISSTRDFTFNKDQFDRWRWLDRAYL